LHIKLIELWNFKSFSRKTRIHFYKGFTTISGPNGSGKSNIIDAILFCLGLSTSHTLRAENLAVFIYDDKDSSKGKKRDFAQVSVVLDNSAREVPFDSDELKITRKVKRGKDGKGGENLYGTYYLNDKVTTLTRIHDLLAHANIRQGTYNVVLQGDVTQITKMNDRQRREIIERVSGTADFDDKTDQAKRELDAVQARIEPQLVFLQDSEKRLVRLDEQRRIAMEHERLTAELSRWQGFILLAQLRQKEAELEKTQGELERKQKLRERLTAKIDRDNAALEGIREEQRDLRRVMERKGGEEQDALRSEIFDLESRVRSSKDMVEYGRLEISEMEGVLRGLQRREAEATERLAGLQQELAEKEELARKSQADLDACRIHVEELKTRLDSADREEEGCREQLEQARAQLEDARGKRGEASLELDRAQDGLRRARESLEVERSQLNTLSGEISDLESKQGEDEENISEYEERAKALASDHVDLQAKAVELRAQLAKLEDELDGVRGEEAKSRFLVSSAREEHQLPRAVEAVLSASAENKITGVLGTVAKLGRVDTGYATALEVTAGGRMQCIVVENDEQAQQGIEYLKSAGAGVATFLPLNRMREPPKRHDPPSEPGVVGWAIDLVEFEPRFKPVFSYVFSDTLVVDDLKTARRLMGRYRLVTLDGDLVERSGAMTGGARGKSRWRFASREEDRLKELQEQLEDLQKKRDDMRGCLAEAAGRVEALEGELSEVAGYTESLRLRMSERQSQLTRLHARQLGVKKGIDSIEREISDRDAREEQAQKSRTAWDRAVLEAEELQAQLAGKLRGSSYEALTRELEDARDDEGQAQRQLEHNSAQVELLSGKVDMTRSDLESITSRQKEQAEKKAEREEAIAARLTQIKADYELIEQYRGKEKELEGDLAQLHGQLEGLEERGQKVDTGVRELESDRAIAISDLNVLEYRREEQAGEVTALRDQVTGKGVPLEGDVPTPKQVEKEIQRTTRELERLGPVNQLAVQQHQEESERRDEITGKVEVLSRERGEILERIERYDSQKREVFLEAFDSINRNFQDVYTELAGGHGEMVLENPDEPFSGGLGILAQPGDKQVKNIMMLSGGEKGLVAVAMVFAIQRWKPSPFYVLDEIDMNLDGANVELVARMIQRASQTAQFIVITLNTPMIELSRRVLGVVNPDDRDSQITGMEVPA